jgi:hypothetical protein
MAAHPVMARLELNRPIVAGLPQFTYKLPNMQYGVETLSNNISYAHG